MAIPKLYLDKRFTTNGGVSHLGLSNNVELGAWVNKYLLNSTTMSLSNVLGIGSTTGGTDLTISAGDSLLFGNGAFTTTLDASTLTADTEITMPSTSGRMLVQRVISVASTPHTAVDGEVILLDTTVTGAAVVNLPPAETNMKITVKNLTGAATITIDGDGAELVEGAATLVIAAVANDFVTLVASGSAWYVIASS